MKLKSYNIQHKKQDFEFYILSKGYNAGKPLENPCPNCFTCSCNTAEEKDFYFWLLWALWKSKYFHQFLTGSVIVFLRLDDVKAEITRHSTAVKENAASFNATIEKVKLFEEREKIIVQQLQQLQQLKIAMLRRHIK